MAKRNRNRRPVNTVDVSEENTTTVVKEVDEFEDAFPDVEIGNVETVFNDKSEEDEEETIHVDEHIDVVVNDETIDEPTVVESIDEIEEVVEPDITPEVIEPKQNKEKTNNEKNVTRSTNKFQIVFVDKGSPLQIQKTLKRLKSIGESYEIDDTINTINGKVFSSYPDAISHRKYLAGKGLKPIIKKI